MKLKKLFTMSIAAVMAVSAMSVSAFASDEGNDVIATIPNNNDIIEVHESDLVNGKYSVDYDGTIITINTKNENTPVMFSTRATKEFCDLYSPESNTTVGVTGSNKQYLTFAVAKGKTQSTPDYYAPGSGKTSLCYEFTADNSYSGKVTATVYLLKNNTTLPINLYDTEAHTVDITDMTTSSKTYATVKNARYSGTATGTCVITN